MFDRLRRNRPSHAAVVAYLALFVALGGSSYAAIRVSSAQIVNNSIRSVDIRNSDIRSADVRNGSLLAQDFRAGQLPAGPQGQKGDPGAAGQQGQAGQQGIPGVSGLVRIKAESVLQASESVKFAQAICPEGKRVIGAGADIRAGVEGSVPNQTTNMIINEIIPSEETVVPGTVTVRAYENLATADEWGVSAFALCANVS